MKQPMQLSCEGLTIDTDAQVVTLHGTVIPLTESEFSLLALLARSPRRIFSREELLLSLRDSSWDKFNRSVDILVSRLRHKLGETARKPRFIRTCRGGGYSFVGDVVQVPA